MLEAAGLALGAFAGLRLGAAARDEVASHEHEDEAAQLENSAGSRRNSRTKLLAKGRARQVEGVVTVMLVGEAGKLCELPAPVLHAPLGHHSFLVPAE